jgi:hypothetical protein
MNTCWLFPPRPPVFVLAGRYGDIIQILPCFYEIYQRTGTKPIHIVSQEYANLLEGVSYVEPYPVPGSYWKMIPEGRRIAQRIFGGGIVLPWWYEDRQHAAMIRESAKGDFVIQCHAQNWGVDIKKWPDYGSSMASRCGFTVDEWLQLPLIFDQRNPSRERILWEKVVGRESRPVVLYNFTGVSSPFGYTPEVVNSMRNTFGRIFRFLDLAAVYAHRIYDLLGLYDHPQTVGLLTSDTATLHLAQGSNVPYIAFTVNGWSSSVPKGNCSLHVKYDNVIGRLPQILKTISSWASTHELIPRIHSVLAERH